MQLLRKISEFGSPHIKQEHLKTADFLEKQVFWYAYHPHKRYFVTDFHVDMNNLGEPNNEMFSLLDDLSERRIVGNEARGAVFNFAQKHGDLIKLICQKDLDCGVAATLLNKVYGKAFIPQFKVQLAKEVPLDKLTWPMIAQVKYDGVRVLAIKRNGKVEFKSRNGKIINIPGLANILEAHDFDNFVLDGEITLKSGKMEDRTTVSGMVNSAMKGGALDITKIVYHLFDSLNVQDFDEQKCPGTYFERYAALRHNIEKIGCEALKVADWIEVISEEGAMALYNSYYEQGFEGIILKDSRHKYTFKRSKDWVKIKAIKTADLLCVREEEGTGKYEGEIGALVCRGIVEGKNIKVNVGSGLTDDDRVKWDEYEGKVIEVKYNEVIPTHDKTGHTLFLPRFVTIREDK